MKTRPDNFLQTSQEISADSTKADLSSKNFKIKKDSQTNQLLSLTKRRCLQKTYMMGGIP
jgi:hypothetical protein